MRMVVLFGLMACGGVEHMQEQEADAGVDAPMVDAPAAARCVASPTPLRARWRGDQSAAEDLGVFGGTLSGGTGYAPGRHGDAFAFDGVDDKLLADPTDLLWPAGSFSLEAWFRTTTVPARYAMIATKYDCGGPANCHGADWEMFIDAEGRLVFSFRVDGGVVHRVRDTLTVATDGAWHHAVGVRDVDGKLEALYVDGALVVSAPIGGIDLGPLANNDGESDPVSIGAVRNSGLETYEGFFAGAIDEVALYGSALTAAEAAALYAAPDGVCR